MSILKAAPHRALFALTILFCASLMVSASPAQAGDNGSKGQKERSNRPVNGLGYDSSPEYQSTKAALQSAHDRSSCTMSVGKLAADKKSIRLPVTNGGKSAAAITQIDISWPSGNKKLKKIKLGDSDIYTEDVDGTSASIRSGWKVGPSGRSLAASTTGTLLLEFNGTASADPSKYSLKLTFDNECEATLGKSAGQMASRDPAIAADAAVEAQTADSVDAVDALLPGQTYSCLPTCSTSDGRFFTLAGTQLATLAGDSISLGFASAADQSSFDIDVFDGDLGGLWDDGAATTEFRLYRDPLANGSGTDMVGMWTNASFVNNAWFSINVTNQPAAAGPSGSYHYWMEITNATPASLSRNSFKLRTNGTISLEPQAFSFIAELSRLEEALVVYPSWPLLSPTTYDGSWDFFVQVPSGSSNFEGWDGDMDYGNYLCTTNDTDDPNTLNAPYKPVWAQGMVAVPEGVASTTRLCPGSTNQYMTGDPPDSNSTPVYSRGSSVTYQIIDSAGNSYANTNPSGNLEWEQFRIDSAPFDASVMDYHAEEIPGGIWRVHVTNMDMGNLNAWRFFADGAGLRVIGVDPDGDPIPPLPAYSLGDTVFFDGNRNGVQDAGEAGIPGVLVNLVDAAGNVVDSTTTDALIAGRYNFFVNPGAYTVQIDASNFAPGGALAGLGSTTGGNAIADSVIDANVLTYDFGYAGSAALGNYVWLDENSDGIQDAGEAGIANVTVELWNADHSTLLGSAVTDAAGGYLFAGLVAASYQVDIPASNFGAGGALAGLSQTTLSSGAAIGADYGNQDYSAGDGTAGYGITLALGDENLSGDFGFNASSTGNVLGNTGTTGAIGDRLWVDANGDGQQDAGEPGLGGVTVNLYGDPDGDGIYDTLLTTTVTDADGSYRFIDLPAAGYVVAVDAATLPAGYIQTGDPDDFGSVATSPDNRTSSPIALAPGDVYWNADFGYQPAAGTSWAIGDRVWFDSNADGLQDAGEPGIAGVTVALARDANNNGTIEAGEIIATDTTDGSGIYRFTGLANGNYIVLVTDSDNILGELAQSGDPDATADGRSLWTIAGADNLAQDFGYTPAGHATGEGLIGDTIFIDRDGDGIADAGEGLEGVSVTVTNTGTGVSYSTTTDENGHYAIGGLPAGSYTVTVNNPPAGYSNSVDPNGGADSTASLTLAAGEINLNQDFGYAAAGTPGSIGNLVWLDVDADGLRDAGEAGIADVTLALYADTNGNGQVDAGEPLLGTTQTDISGAYLFGGLATDDGAGDAAYVVVVTDATGALGGYWKSTGAAATDNNSQTSPYGVTLTPAANQNLTADFGYYVDAAALGNYVWFDYNSNGIQDATETPIAGLRVTLTIAYPNGSTVSLATTTDATGAYAFGNLLLDEGFNGDGVGSEPTFTIAVTAPAGVVATSIGAAGSTSLDDSNDPAGASAQPVQGQTDVTLLASPNLEPAIAGYDFGFVGSYAIGDSVWHDTNKDGVQNGGELGLAGVTVKLVDAGGNLVASTTTDLTGNYRFENLIPGDYQVVIDPANFAPTGALAGMLSTTGGDSQSDSLVDSDLLTYDFGYVADSFSATTIGNTVWYDSNGDGFFNSPGENGIAGVTIKLHADVNGDGLLDGGDQLLSSQVTDVAGQYIFSGAQNGKYLVEVVPATVPAGYQPSLDQSASANDGANRSSPHALTITSNQSYLRADFGYVELGSIGDRIWSETDGDGLYEPGAGETGVEGVVVNLLNARGAVIATTTTDANGNYSFDNLLPGDYTIAIDASNFSLGGALEGKSPSADESANAADGSNRNSPWAVTLAAGEDYALADFGYVALGSIGDTVWTETDGDGLYEPGAGETGLAGVTVNLLDAGGAVIATTTTDANGNYLFDNLVAGDYTIAIDAGNFGAGQPLAGANPSADQSANAADDANRNSPWSLKLGAGEDYTRADFGFVGAFSVGDLVWYDLDLDGIQAPGELGLGGVLVNLLDAGGNVIASTTTDRAGNYRFDSLIPGDYTVEIDASNFASGGALAGMVSTSGGDSQLDSLVDADNLNYDFGYVADGGGASVTSIGDTVWFDANRDGFFALVGENGIAGVTLKLYADLNGDGLLDGGDLFLGNQITDADGQYLFSGAQNGAYLVVVDPASLPAGYEPTLDQSASTSDGASRSTPHALTIAGNQAYLLADFGYVLLGSIGDTVWSETDGDGLYEPGAGETGVAGVLVNLLDSAGDVIASMSTDANGNYRFDGLIAGEYTIEIDASNFDAGAALAGKSPSANQSANAADGSNRGSPWTVALAAGQDYALADFGYVTLGSIGDRVWLETDGDGIYEPTAGETGLANVSLELRDAGGVVIATATTDADGNYRFDNLIAGDYTVAIAASNFDAGGALAGLSASADQSASANDDANRNSPWSLTLGAGETYTRADFGFVGLGSIGDTVWSETDGDGLYVPGAGETGLAGVTVNLLDAGGAVIATATTDASGNYRFDDLVAGDYTVAIAASNFDAGGALAGLSASADQSASANDDANRNSPWSLTLGVGEAYTRADFGFVALGSIGDTVWSETDGDGRYEPTAGESGVADVLMELLDAGGNVIATTTTDASGNYRFDGLLAGDYSVRVASSNFVSGGPLVGLSNSADQSASTDNDVNRGSPWSLTLGAGEAYTRADFGYLPAQRYAVGDLVWYDNNLDGAQNDGELGLAGVVVKLLDADGDLVATTTTDRLGAYRFEDLLPGDYTVQIDASNFASGGALEGMSSSTGGDSIADSLIDANLLTYDFGYVSSGGGASATTIGDTVWNDSNGDGFFALTGENGIAGVLVKLYADLNDDGMLDVNDLFLGSQTTDSDGSYLFTGVQNGDYLVVVAPANFGAGGALAGLIQTMDQSLSINDGANRETPHALTIANHQAYQLADFGYVLPGSIGDTVWSEADGDGLYAPTNGELGVAGVSLRLRADLDGDGILDVDRTTTTGAGGSYLFEGLLPGAYTVEVLASNFAAGGPLAGLVNSQDQSANAADGANRASPWGHLLTAGEAYRLADFGYRSTQEPCGTCVGKVTQLTLRYNGSVADAHIEVVQKTQGNQTGVAFDGIVQPGANFSFDGLDKWGTLGPTIELFVNGSKVAELHTSCSQPIGPGTVAGNFLVVRGYSRNGGLLCPVGGPVTTPTPEPTPSDSCAACSGKVSQLTLRYNGSQANAQVQVRQRNKDASGGTSLAFNGTVQPGASFSFSGVDSRGTLGTNIEILVNGLLAAEMHTSCSVPIGPGTVAGDFLVLDGSSLNGGLLCPVAGPPSTPTPWPSSTPTPSPEPSPEPSPTPTLPPASGPCSVCNGKVTQLTLRYNGSVAGARIEVVQKTQGNQTGKAFDGTVQPGASFSFDGLDKWGTLGPNIEIYVNGSKVADLHTSCSQPIGPGTVAGDFLVTKGYSRNGGLLCPVNSAPAP